MSQYDPGRPGGDDLNDAAPRVGVQEKSWEMPAAVGGSIILGLAVFFGLAQGRIQTEEARLTDPAPGSAPIIGLENVPPPPDLTAMQIAVATPPAPTAPALAPSPAPTLPPPAPLASDQMTNPELDARRRAPSLIVDLSEASATTVTEAPTGGPRPSDITQAIGGQRNAINSEALNTDERFAQRLGAVGDDAPVRANQLTNKGAIVAQGSVIPAVLETAIQSDLPGFVRAVVSRDIYSFDGRNVLIPRGSRVVGQYRSGVALGQSRAFVIWTRLVRPDGASVALGAPGADALGRGGLPGQVDNHFLERFGGAILLSLISAGASAASSGDDTQVIINSSRNAADAAAMALPRPVDISPTIKVEQGAPIRIFVQRDLDFSAVQDEAG